MDIEGLGEQRVQLFVDHGLLDDVADLYSFTPATFDGLEGFAAMSIANLLAPSTSHGPGRSTGCSSGWASAISARSARRRWPGPSVTSTAIIAADEAAWPPSTGSARSSPPAWSGGSRPVNRVGGRPPPAGRRESDRARTAVDRRAAPSWPRPSPANRWWSRDARGVHPRGGRGGRSWPGAASRPGACRRRPTPSWSGNRPGASKVTKAEQWGCRWSRGGFAALLETGEIPTKTTKMTARPLSVRDSTQVEGGPGCLLDLRVTPR